ncbi:hypothetical protein GLA29479_4508 [Lysobacter antibioticus]|nr:hypothetical protein GLA29479_4508 [Lysobacter antibioticus]
MLPTFLFKQYLGWRFRSSETCFRSRRSAAVAPALSGRRRASIF